MKVYDLGCEHDHCFEGWFSSEADFTAQQEQGHIECPVCESRKVRKLPSAPRLNLSTPQTPANEPAVQLQAKVMEFLRQVVANTEDVGARFAEEARRIHYKETPERAIRGVASIQECEALTDEGIDIVALPLPKAAKQTLQ